MSEWLERELSRQMAPVRAPQNLWDRIQQRPAPMPAAMRWPVAAVLTLASFAGTLWLAGIAPRPVPYALVRTVHAAGPQGPNWDVRCTLPARTPAVQLASFSVRKLPNAPMPAPLERRAEASCFQCHAAVEN